MRIDLSVKRTTMNNIGDSSNYHDLVGLQELKSKSKLDPENKEALQLAAQHFESIFIGMMLKSMREANAVFEEGNPMHSNTTKFFRDMYDSQLATDMADQGSMGLADIIVQQLSGDKDNFTNASTLRTDNRFEQLVKDISLSKKPAEVMPKEAMNIVPALNNAQDVKTNEKPTVEFDSPDSFVEQVWHHAKQTASRIGMNPAVMIAQSALETGWGQHVIKDKDGQSSFNLFNVKALRDWDGDKTGQTTVEFENGIAVKKVQPFRVYNSISESFEDFISFLKSDSRYEPALEKSGDPEQFLHKLQSAGYATDPNYAEKIIGILKSDRFKDMINKVTSPEMESIVDTEKHDGNED